MLPATIEAIRQSLDKACRLVKPRRATLQAFAGELAKLLANTQDQHNEAQVKAWLLAMLPGSCLAPDDEQPPGNSSPVCYAHVAGLREGFEDAAPPANRLTGNSDLRQALHAAQNGLRLLLDAAPAPPPASAALENQVTALLYQLYELSPEEIAALNNEG